VASSGKQWQAVASSGKQWQAVASSLFFDVFRMEGSQDDSIFSGALLHILCLHRFCHTHMMK